MRLDFFAGCALCSAHVTHPNAYLWGDRSAQPSDNGSDEPFCLFFVFVSLQLCAVDRFVEWLKGASEVQGSSILHFNHLIYFLLMA